MQHAEDILRGREDDEIMNLVGEERVAKEASVEERRKKWQRHFDAQKGRLAQLQAQGAGASATTLMTSTPTATPQSSQNSINPLIPSPGSKDRRKRRRSWLWFKLKRRTS